MCGRREAGHPSFCQGSAYPVLVPLLCSYCCFSLSPTLLHLRVFLLWPMSKLMLHFQALLVPLLPPAVLRSHGHVFLWHSTPLPLCFDRSEWDQLDPWESVAVRRSQSAPYTHVLVCICSNGRQSNSKSLSHRIAMLQSLLCGFLSA